MGRLLSSPGGFQGRGVRGAPTPAPGVRMGAIGTFASDPHAVFGSRTGLPLPNGTVALILRPGGASSPRADPCGQDASDRDVCERSARGLGSRTGLLLPNGPNAHILRRARGQGPRATPTRARPALRPTKLSVRGSPAVWPAERTTRHRVPCPARTSSATRRTAAGYPPGRPAWLPSRSGLEGSNRRPDRSTSR